MACTAAAAEGPTDAEDKAAHAERLVAGLRRSQKELQARLRRERRAGATRDRLDELGEDIERHGDAMTILRLAAKKTVKGAKTLGETLCSLDETVRLMAWQRREIRRLEWWRWWLSRFLLVTTFVAVVLLVSLVSRLFFNLFARWRFPLAVA